MVAGNILLFAISDLDSILQFIDWRPGQGQLVPSDCIFLFSVTDIGPYTLGESVKLRCLSTRGRPSPNVTWWRDNAVLIDESFDSHLVDGDDVVINDLELHGLQRQHRDSILTCKAVNNILSPPAVASVKILMHCKNIIIMLSLLHLA